MGSEQMADVISDSVWQVRESAPTDGRWIYVSGVDEDGHAYEDQPTYYGGVSWPGVDEKWEFWRPCSALPQLRLGATHHREGGIWVPYGGDQGGMELEGTPAGAMLSLGAAGERATGRIELTPERMIRLSEWLNGRIGEMLLDAKNGPPE